MSLLLLKATLIIHYLVQNIHFRRKKQRVREMTWTSPQCWAARAERRIQRLGSGFTDPLETTRSTPIWPTSVLIPIFLLIYYLSFFCIFNFYLYLLNPSLNKPFLQKKIIHCISPPSLECHHYNLGNSRAHKLLLLYFFLLPLMLLCIFHGHTPSDTILCFITNASHYHPLTLSLSPSHYQPLTLTISLPTLN